LKIRKSIKNPSSQGEILFASSETERNNQFLRVVPLTYGDENDNNLEGIKT